MHAIFNRFPPARAVMLAGCREGCISQGRSVHRPSPYRLGGVPSRFRIPVPRRLNFPKRDVPPTNFSTSSTGIGFAVESLLGPPSRRVNLLVTQVINLTRI